MYHLNLYVLSACMDYTHSVKWAGNIFFSMYTLSLLGNVYGRGVYFARDASGAANDRYSPRDNNGHKHMYLARVLVGEYTVGKKDLIVPPPKDPTKPGVLYDSVVDNQEHPRVFCIFQDSQVYPDYHIEFC